MSAMNCDEARELLDALADGELADAERGLVEQHLATCPGCRDEFAAIRALSAQVRRAAGFATPGGLDGRIRQALAADEDETRKRSAVAVLLPSGRRLIALSHLVAALAGGAIAASVAVIIPGGRPGFGEEALSAHIGTMMTDQFARVVSSDSHTVKPWFAGKLDYSPPVVDLASKGFPLRTGHVDYLMDRPVAVLDYQRGAHHVSLFIVPSAAAPVSRQQSTIRGYTVDTWETDGFSYAAVSDADAEAVRQFVALFQSATASPDAGDGQASP
jgi:anti-sigma factor RsiW